MDTDRNLLFGVLALQADLIDRDRFVQACALWAARKDRPLADLLVEQGWLTPQDRADVERLLERKLVKAAPPGPVDMLARTLEATVDHVSQPGERYTRTRLHATGGIGRVWLARDHALGRDVALKELRPEGAGHASLQARFLQEARITGQLEHPGVVPVYELAHRPGDAQPFYTMRFVKGRTLSEAVHDYHDKRRAGRAKALDLPALLHAFVSVCHTVAYAHSRGILHRDLKPQNIVLGDFGEVVVLDWGLAKHVGRPPGETPEASLVLDTPDSGEADLTIQGQTLGTPAYMAPEQAVGRLDLIDVRTDVYGLGAILYEILAGQPPFTGTETFEVLRRVREEEPVPPRQHSPDVPAGLEAVCLQALAKLPADRHASAGELAWAVQGWQEHQRLQAEEALRASEALYHSLVDTLPLSVWRKDLEGRFTFGNKRFCESVGLSREEILGKTDADFYPAELAAKYRRDDIRVHESGRPLDVLEDHVTPTGERLFVQVVKSPIFDAQGAVVGTQGIFWDLTDRKRVEEELRRSKERFELAVQGSQDGLWDWDLRTNEVWNSPRMSSMLGDAAEEARTTFDEWADRLHPEDRARALAALRDYFDGKAAHYASEYRLRHRDGSYRWFLGQGVALRDADGKPYRMAGSREDVTERKRLEEQLRQAHAELERLRRDGR
jgi:PAS domain S-box-containing protein